MAISAIVNTAASGLQASARRVQAAASNLANIASEGYAARDVRTVSVGNAAVPGGVSTVIVEEGEVEVVDQYVRLIQARTAYSLAAETLAVADDLARETTDIVS